MNVTNYLNGTSKLKDEAAYNITKAILENLEDLSKMNPKFKEWSLHGAINDPVLPFHPGAIKYYKEKGVWDAQMEELQKKLLEEGP